MRLIMPKDTVACKSNREGKGIDSSLEKTVILFTSRQDISAADLNAGYLISNDTALASKPYCEGEIVKTSMLKAAEIVCSEKLKFLLILA